MYGNQNWLLCGLCTMIPWQSGLYLYLTVLDLKTSCRALSACVRCSKTISLGSRVPQPMRNCHESHVNNRLFQHGGDRAMDTCLASSLNGVSRVEKSASLRQARVLTNFKPIWPRQKICSSTTKKRLVCGGLYFDRKITSMVYFVFAWKITWIIIYVRKLAQNWTIYRLYNLHWGAN